MRISKTIALFIIVLFIFTLVYTTVSNAIPAFARRYKVSCTTCHSPIPRLKPYGDEFAGNGFIIPEDENARDYVTAGDDMLWLNKTFPLAVRFDAFAVYNKDLEVDKDIQTPYGLKLLSGGTLYKNIGYYFYFYMYERGEVSGVEDAYIHFNNLFNQPLDILVGQFQVCDPLMKRELRLTLDDYKIYGAEVGHSRIKLTYDRGIMLMYDIEKTGTNLVATVVNGNGKTIAGEAGTFDDDGYKNFGLRLRQSFGDILSIGGFYYAGKEKEIIDEEVGQFENKVTFIGPDLNMIVGPFQLTVQYLIRKDTNPGFINQPTELETKGTVAELVYSPKLDRSRFYITVLYNKIDSDYVLAKYETATLSGTYLLARNLRLIGEYTRNLEAKMNQFALGMLTAF